ncbi:carbohydrate esterase [Pyrus ussuriensis x Pyrus communis]|uniref:Carbohydrate esterase n=1 Tax=Pyrus ussuriensis x Pyrus communis TaxID=2448454 RepID=A0A5N5I6V0_9ROSA|nr:carbohydrate esterase [Pyrus ussuriensis x Pyrus communis]
MATQMARRIRSKTKRSKHAGYLDMEIFGSMHEGRPFRPGMLFWFYGQEQRGSDDIQSNDQYNMEEVVMPLHEYINDPIAQEIVHSRETFQIGSGTEISANILTLVVPTQNLVWKGYPATLLSKLQQSLVEILVIRQGGECSGSSGRIDAKVTGSEDSSAPTRKSISLNSSNRDSFGRKDLKHRLNMENAMNAGDMENAQTILSEDNKYMEKVREAQLGMEIPNVVCVDAKELELKDDHQHLTSKSQVQLGRMLADAYLQRFGPSEPDSHAAI